MLKKEIENKHKAFKLYWKSLSSKGKKLIATKTQRQIQCLNEIAKDNETHYPKSLIYDLHSFSKERYEIEQRELKTKIKELC